MRKTKKKDTKVYSSMTITELEEMMSDRETAFIEQYEINNDTASAVQQAGYKPNKSRSAYAMGSRLLKEPKIAAYIKLRRHELFERLDLNKETLAVSALYVYNRAMQGVPHVVWNHEKKIYEQDRTITIDSKSAICALKLICDMLSITQEKTVEYETIEEYIARTDSSDYVSDE